MTEEITYGLNNSRTIFYLYLPKTFIKRHGKPEGLKYHQEKDIWFEYTIKKQAWNKTFDFLESKISSETLQNIKSLFSKSKQYVLKIKNKNILIKTTDKNIQALLQQASFLYDNKYNFFHSDFETALNHQNIIDQIDPEIIEEIKETLKPKPYIQDVNKQLIQKHLIKYIPDYLYDFQKEFVEKALTDYLNGETGIMLADDVGLGKSAQSLGVAAALLKADKIDKVLIVTKKNVVKQFASEVKSFLNITPEILSTQHWEPQNSTVLISNFAPISKFVDQWKLVPKGKEDRVLFIIDEVTNLKNPDNARRKAFNKLFKTYPGFRIGMTATPFGKELVDMFYMFNLLVPDFMSWPRFDNRHRNTFTINKQIRTKYGKTFTKKIDIVKNYKNFKEFHNAISPHMVRRKKNIADKALGPKHTHPIFLPVSDKFLELYNRFSNDIVNAVKKQYNKKEQGLATLLGVSLLRQFCNYVGLFEESSAKLLSHIPYREYMIETPTPKLDWTVNTVKKIDDKVIIFTEFAKMANVLNNHLTNLGYKTKIITGSTERDDREELRKSFQKDRFQILVGTNAIAYGGNFQFVDHLINYDMAYNPEVNWQREGRIHRLGNTNEKHIYNLTLQSGIPDSPLIEELIYQKVTRRMQEAEKAVDGRELEIDHNDDSVIKEISKKLFK